MNAVPTELPKFLKKLNDPVISAISSSFTPTTNILINGMKNIIIPIPCSVDTVMINDSFIDVDMPANIRHESPNTSILFYPNKSNNIFKYLVPI